MKTSKSVQEILTYIRALSRHERELLDEKLKSDRMLKFDVEAFIESTRFADGRVCPRCGGKHVVKNGTKNGKARYRCNDCKRHFSNNTNTVIAWSHKDIETWNRFLQCMLELKTIRQSAAICNISNTTAFAWRHKILDCMRQNVHDHVVLSGVTEADEKYANVSYKGDHKKSSRFTMPRKKHKRGNDVHVRGLSSEQVCITCAIDRRGKSVAAPTNLAKPRSEDIANFLAGHIAEQSTICTDKNRSYNRLVEEKKLQHVILNSSKREYTRGQYGIQRINNYHSQLQKFLVHFAGVSTKYLNNYLVWHNFVNYAKETVKEKLRLLQVIAMASLSWTKGYSISCRPPIPF